MSVDVTVVVPVYNPGRYLDVCVDSLLAQSIPVEARELVFVDDGSTDETPARLDELAASIPGVTAIHQPNSGWPGKPRNVGIDLAAGDFVFFCDHDDRLGPEALERMVAMARRTEADVLVPKMVGNGRPVPHRLFQQNIDHAVLGADSLMESLTPHKLFRRAFLNDIGLRFPEGRRRLEDHVFVVEAYLRARGVAVLADYPCYHRVHRDDDGNASVQGLDPDFYFRFVAETLDVIERLTEPGELRDSLLVRPYGGELVGKLAERKVHRWDADLRRRILDQIQPMMRDRFPAGVADRMPIARRAHARAILDDDLASLITVADATASIGARAQLTAIAWNGRTWIGEVEVGLMDANDEPVPVTDIAGGFAVAPTVIPPSLAPPSYSREDILAGYADVIVRNDDAVEWYVASQPTAAVVPIPDDPGGASSVVYRIRVELDPATLAGGRPLGDGRWDVRVRLDILGVSRNVRLRADPALLTTVPSAWFAASDAVVGLAVSGPRHNVGLDVGSPPKSLVRLVAQHTEDLTIGADQRVNASIRVAAVEAELPRSFPVVLLAGDDTVVATLDATLAAGVLRTDPLPPQPTTPSATALAWVDVGRGRAFVVGQIGAAADGAVTVATCPLRAVPVKRE